LLGLIFPLTLERAFGGGDHAVGWQDGDVARGWWGCDKEFRVATTMDACGTMRQATRCHRAPMVGEELGAMGGPSA
jgi:hypothetical protein